MFDCGGTSIAWRAKVCGGAIYAVCRCLIGDDLSEVVCTLTNLAICISLLLMSGEGVSNILLGAHLVR